MYLCLNCGNLFEEPSEWEERHGLHAPPYEKWVGCPKCKGSYIETFKCSDCGCYIVNNYIVLNNGDCYCENCTTQKQLK